MSAKHTTYLSAVFLIPVASDLPNFHISADTDKETSLTKPVNKIKYLT